MEYGKVSNLEEKQKMNKSPNADSGFARIESDGQKSEKVLIFGGAFSPPTLSHQQIIKHALSLPGFKKVLLMPSRDRLDKIVSASEDIRLKLLRQLIEVEFLNHPRLLASDFELQLPPPSSTYKTHLKLQEVYPNLEFTYIVGEDSIATMNNKIMHML